MVASSVFLRLESAGKLPTPPGVVHRLLELTRRGEVTVREVADTIAGDPSLAAKVLRFVNSPMAGVAQEVTSIHQAVALVGVRGVATMALSLAVTRPARHEPCAGFDRDRYNIQSLACGAAAKVLAQRTRAAAPQEAFAAGLLSQIGRSVFAAALPGEYATVLAQARHAPRDLPELEKAALGDTYPNVGAQLLRRWGLPEALCAGIQRFREASGASDVPTLSRLLNAAEIAACTICSTTGSASCSEEFLRAVHREFGIAQEAAIAALNEIGDETRGLRAVFEVPGGHVRSAEEVESEIRERIAEMSIAMHLENQSMAQQQADLLRRASTDALTGIGNRAAFDARLEYEMERAARGGSPLGLLLIDVDHFKAFNDQHGHQAGDRVLQTVARTLDENVRKVDFVARYGGEEFAVIAPGTPIEGVTLLAERLRQGVEAATVPWEGRALGVTISIGVAVFTEVTDQRDATGIVRQADEQLYKAKKAGRNRVHGVSGHQPGGVAAR